MHLIVLHWVMNPHQRCLHANVKNRSEPKQLMPKSQDLNRSLEKKVIWTFDAKCPTIFIVKVWYDASSCPQPLTKCIYAVIDHGVRARK